MKRIVKIISIILALVLAVACSGMGRKECSKEKAAAIGSVKMTSGLHGRVEVWEGNFMPMTEPGKGGKITPAVGRRVRVHEPVRMDAGGLAQARRDSVTTAMIAEAVTDSIGSFLIPVAPGEYSVFVEENGGWYYNGWNSQGVQGAVKVLPDSVSEIVIKITTKAIH